MAEQAQRLERIESGLSLRVGARKRLGRDLHAWDFDWQQPATGSQTTRLVFLGWGEVIRSHWPKGLMGLVWGFIPAYQTILLRIRLGRVRQLDSKAFITGAWPLLWVVSLAAGLLLIWFTLPWLPAALGACVTILAWRWLALRTRMGWLLRIYIFITRLARGGVPETSALVDQLTNHFFDSVQGLEKLEMKGAAAYSARMEDQEILIVAHSVGAILAPLLVDRILRDLRFAGVHQPLYLLTLGQCIPFVALVPEAKSYRDSVAAVGQDSRVRWHDVTGRIDSLCFHATPPLALTDHQHSPMPSLTHSTARFYPMYEPEHWRTFRRDKLRAHFLYLMTGDRPGNFNLYQFMASPKPLAQAFEEVLG
jgi:hypothetical protein